VGVYKTGRVEIIPNDQGNRITPSYVAWDGDERLVGDAAKNQAAMNPHNTVFDAKRLIGRKFAELTEADKRMPYKIVAAANGDAPPSLQPHRSLRWLTLWMPPTPVVPLRLRVLA
jgi:L1 cell adhesion molecule like protein